MTSLMLASEAGFTDVVSTLVKHGADVNLQNKDLYSALVLAATANKVEVVRLLCEKEGIQIDAKTVFGKTAAFMAAEFGRLEPLKILVQHGADVNELSKRGMSSLMLACVKGHTDIITYLIEEADANLKIRTSDSSVTEHSRESNFVLLFF